MTFSVLLKTSFLRSLSSGSVLLTSGDQRNQPELARSASAAIDDDHDDDDCKDDDHYENYAEDESVSFITQTNNATPDEHT